MKQFTLKLSLVFSILIALTFNLSKAQSNQYLDFDGVDDYVSVANGSQLIAGSSSITITGWFYDNMLSYGKGMIGYRATAGEFYLLELNTGAVECRFKNSAGTTYDVAPVNFTIIPQQWQHFAMVLGSNSLKLYVNGNLVGTKATTGTISSTTIPFTIGKSILSGQNFVYSGRVDEVSVWNKALTQTEIQDMIANELTGTEPNLQLYYKFNQGVPGGNNTSIASLTTAVNSPTYDGTFNFFALNGATSNFNGTLNASFQAISFPQVPTQLTTSPPYQLTAAASSGLPVTYTLVSGPATLNGSIITLTGVGTVIIQADQYGNASYDSAASVINTFDVVDPALNLPQIESRNPVAGQDVYMPTLGALELAAVVNIPYPTIFSVQGVQFVVNGNTYPATDHGNGHYTAWWTPTAFGPVTINVVSTSNFGATNTVPVNVNVNQTITNINNVPVFSGIWLNSSTPADSADALLPSFVGAFDSIELTLTTTCPAIGCNSNYDRVASIDARGHDGKWFEIIRYITPYDINGPCTHKINLADYMSILQGKVWFRINCITFDNGFNYALKIDYYAGAPAHKYSKVTQVWKAVYPFGDYANLQPVPVFNYAYPTLSIASKLKLVSTGHGWGSLNTSNAAEFYNATHNIWVNGANTFSQHNWNLCGTNPDGCSPQGGTWTNNRAGWCPGSIARYFDYDMSPFVSAGNIALEYKFYSAYLDQCHPNNPNCVTGVTCSDCSDGFNPILDVNCNLVTFFDDPAALAVKEIDNVDL
ncbi:MAG: LamG-like jellyroll fold domain-containing protein, partial [Bacteroidia bacterium]